MNETRTLSAREEQKTLNAEITIVGMPDWLERFKVETVDIRPELASLFGGRTTLPRYDAVMRGAELNDVSFERELLSDLLTEGYSFSELEISLRAQRDWGRMIWYKDHPNYQEPTPPEYKDAFERKIFVPGYYSATFKTETAGDQIFCLYSTQMFMSSCILLHKTILYHRAVLNPPK